MPSREETIKKIVDIINRDRAIIQDKGDVLQVKQRGQTVRIPLISSSVTNAVNNLK